MAGLLVEGHDFAAAGQVADYQPIFTGALVIHKHFLIEVLGSFRALGPGIVRAPFPPLQGEN